MACNGNCQGICCWDYKKVDCCIHHDGSNDDEVVQVGTDKTNNPEMQEDKRINSYSV